MSDIAAVRLESTHLLSSGTILSGGFKRDLEGASFRDGDRTADALAQVFLNGLFKGLVRQS